MDMGSLAEEPDPAFFIADMPEPEEDAGTTDQLPVNVTTINASADPSGERCVPYDLMQYSALRCKCVVDNRGSFCCHGCAVETVECHQGRMVEVHRKSRGS